MAVINIYVSTDLRARMNRYPDVAWSQVAQRAFEYHILCIEHVSKTKRDWIIVTKPKDRE